VRYLGVVVACLVMWSECPDVYGQVSAEATHELGVSGTYGTIRESPVVKPSVGKFDGKIHLRVKENGHNLVVNVLSADIKTNRFSDPVLIDDNVRTEFPGKNEGRYYKDIFAKVGGLAGVVNVVVHRENVEGVLQVVSFEYSDGVKVWQAGNREVVPRENERRGDIFEAIACLHELLLHVDWVYAGELAPGKRIVSEFRKTAGNVPAAGYGLPNVYFGVPEIDNDGVFVRAVAEGFSQDGSRQRLVHADPQIRLYGSQESTTWYIDNEYQFLWGKREIALLCVQEADQ